MYKIDRREGGTQNSNAMTDPLITHPAAVEPPLPLRLLFILSSGFKPSLLKTGTGILKYFQTNFISKDIVRSLRRRTLLLPFLCTIEVSRSLHKGLKCEKLQINVNFMLRTVFQDVCLELTHAQL